MEGMWSLRGKGSSARRMMDCFSAMSCDAGNCLGRSQLSGRARISARISAQTIIRRSRCGAARRGRSVSSWRSGSTGASADCIVTQLVRGCRSRCDDLRHSLKPRRRTTRPETRKDAQRSVLIGVVSPGGCRMSRGPQFPFEVDVHNCCRDFGQRSGELPSDPSGSRDPCVGQQSLRVHRGQSCRTIASCGGRGRRDDRCNRLRSGRSAAEPAGQARSRQDDSRSDSSL